jgi:isoquinoline 1-oxidoreductase beta subunit
MASLRKAQPAASRRHFLKASAAAGACLVVGFRWGDALAQTGPSPTFMPNAFVKVAPDSTVTVMIKHLEMGQGVYTGLATIVAEELDADWSQIRVEAAPSVVALYRNSDQGPYQGTGGSASIFNSYEQLRQAGATARAMLASAAGQQWDVPLAEVTIERGVVKHARTNRQASFGELTRRAADLPVPTNVQLKDPARFTLIGQRVPRVDTAAKTDGTAIYALDVRLPNMLTAVVARPPKFGAVLTRFDATAARAVPGVTDVVQIPAGVAVVARNTWAAMKGREALRTEWNEINAETRGTAQLMAEYRALAERPGAVARNDGDADAALAAASRTITAVYEFPYLAHAPMEPLDCVLQLGPDRMEIWAGDQNQTVDQLLASRVVGLLPEQVTINTLYAGGSFGRRANPTADYIVEAATIAKAINGRAPVKLVWTREDDIKGGRYRPLTVHAMAATLDAQGKPVAWRDRIVSQSIMTGAVFEPFAVANGFDRTTTHGALNMPYAIPNVRLENHNLTRIGIPVLWWRSVGNTHTAFANEVFIDELAAAAVQDPVAYRMALLGNKPRHRAVMELAAQRAGWGTPLPPGKGRGIAVHESFRSFVAQVAEVTVSNGRFKVDRVVCAVDCGVAINPDVIAAQMEGGIGYGLGAAMLNAITIENGVVQESNFHDYRTLRIDEMPKVEVYIVPSSERPTGVGEPGTAPIAPAVCNALAAATGQRYRSLPFAQHFPNQ